MRSSVIKKLLRPISCDYDNHFNGEIMNIGKASVSIKRPKDPKQTVICVPGFLENYLYFSHAYLNNSKDLEVILFTPCNYHVPANNSVSDECRIDLPVNYAENTIEYDATALIEVVRKVASTESIVIHGHSRGGAVIIEAASRWPELFQDIEIILEAPVLPQAKLYPILELALNKVKYKNFPWLMDIAKNAPLFFHMPTFGRINRAKKEHIPRVFTSTKNYLTVVRNIENIFAWTEKTPYEAIKAIGSGTILLPEVDRVLDIESMTESANHADKETNVVKIKGTSHFILLDDESGLKRAANLSNISQLFKKKRLAA